MRVILDESDVIAYLGEPEKVEGDELIYTCPLCREEGGDKTGDNLKFNSKKGFITCFADAEHSRSIFVEILSCSDTEYKECNADYIQQFKSLEIDDSYINQCFLALQNNISLQCILQKQRGLSFETLKLGIGFDDEKCNYVFPAYNADRQLIGAEFRPLSQLNGTVFKAKGTRTDLAFINFPVNPVPILIITEGFIDAYTMWQYLCGLSAHNDYQIATPTNGAQTVVNLLNKVKVTEYNKVIFALDNDEAGLKALDGIKDRAKFNYEVWKIPCGCCKDFNEHYLKHVRSEK